MIRAKNNNLNFYKNFYKNIKSQNNYINSENYINLLFKSIEKTNNSKKKIYGMKEPYIGDILKLLINIKNLYIINLIRDPREVFFSRNYSKVKNHGDFKNKKHPVLLSALMCNRNMETDLKLVKNNKYLSIKFNELINNQKKVEKKIYKFLNLKISLNLKKIKKKAKWKINSSGDKGNFGSIWKGKIKKNELEVIEKICGKNFKKYGFKKQIKDKKILNKHIKRFKEDPTKILKWTKKKLFLKYSQAEIAKL